jgi:curved DNA-binding protein CbpA
MGIHSFSLDPRTVLAVGPCATPDEIREAYHLKSKKHHPDRGGDEWAFRMVARAYEVLKTIPVTASADGSRQANGWARAAAEHGSAEKPEEALDKFRTVDVNLIWIRLETEQIAKHLSVSEDNEETLSVCLAISWPDTCLVAQAAEYDSAGEILRTLVDLFQRLRDSDRVFAGRSRIEDGQFVGWLSYPNVLAAQDAFLLLREALKDRGLAVKLRTKDERVPVASHLAE